MKTINFTTRFAFFMLLTSAFVVLQSCVSYYPASYVSDGIYVRSDNRAYQTYSNGSSFYSSYFAGKPNGRITTQITKLPILMITQEIAILLGDKIHKA